MQEDLDRLVDWANTWQMNFNIDKCAVVHIGNNNTAKPHNGNQQTIATEEQCHVGITITKDLKWQKHTEKSCKTSN